MSQSIMVKAKQSVDSTVDAYIGRTALMLSAVAGAAFFFGGLWIVLVQSLGTIGASFTLALIFVAVSAAIKSAITASERRTNSKIADVENSIDESAAAAAGAFTFDLPALLSFAPAILPLSFAEFTSPV